MTEAGMQSEYNVHDASYRAMNWVTEYKFEVVLDLEGAPGGEDGEEGQIAKTWFSALDLYALVPEIPMKYLGYL